MKDKNTSTLIHKKLHILIYECLIVSMKEEKHFKKWQK